jgi:uncharacterized protein (DUF486 family)
MLFAWLALITFIIIIIIIIIFGSYDIAFFNFTFEK